MKIIFSLIGIIFICLTVSGQSDSTKLPAIRPEYDFLYQELFNFDPASTFGSVMPGLSFLQKDFKGLNNPPTSDFSHPISLNNYSSFTNFTLVHPLISSFSVQHAASYRLNNRLNLRGNSFSAGSVFNSLPPNPGFKEMNINGASMFLQYKISKNIRIEGGVSITDY